MLIELDEMWHYLGSKKNKLWIWKAYGRETGELIDWECGTPNAPASEIMAYARENDFKEKKK